jgi:hypothetical protein
MPVEDASVLWSEDQSPYRPVARITAAAQDIWSDGKVRAPTTGCRSVHGTVSRPIGLSVR